MSNYIYLADKNIIVDLLSAVSRLLSPLWSDVGNNFKQCTTILRETFKQVSALKAFADC